MPADFKIVVVVVVVIVIEYSHDYDYDNDNDNDKTVQKSRRFSSLSGRSVLFACAYQLAMRAWRRGGACARTLRLPITNGLPISKDRCDGITLAFKTALTAARVTMLLAITLAQRSLGLPVPNRFLTTPLPARGRL
jgi:hypothetical protein